MTQRKLLTRDAWGACPHCRRMFPMWEFEQDPDEGWCSECNACALEWGLMVGYHAGQLSVGLDGEQDLLWARRALREATPTDRQQALYEGYIRGAGEAGDRIETYQAAERFAAATIDDFYKGIDSWLT